MCEWPVVGIALTRSEIDAEQVGAAASEAVVLWEDDDRAGPGRGVSSQYMRGRLTSASAYRFAGSERAYVVPSLTHLAS